MSDSGPHGPLVFDCKLVLWARQTADPDQTSPFFFFFFFFGLQVSVAGMTNSADPDQTAPFFFLFLIAS